MIEWIEEHPIPILLLGGAVATYVYEMRKRRYSDEESYSSEWEFEEGGSLPAGSLSGSEWYPGNVSSYPTSGEGAEPDLEAGDSHGPSRAREKASELKHRAQEALHRARRRASETSRELRQRSAHEMERLRERSQRAWTSSRNQVVGVMEERPLSVGLGFLALGVIAGMMIPATSTEHRWLGDTASQIKEKTREAAEEAIERGKSVIGAARSAAEREAERQGLTASQLSEKARAVAESAKDAGKEALNKEPAPVTSTAGTGPNLP